MSVASPSKDILVQRGFISPALCNDLIAVGRHTFAAHPEQYPGNLATIYPEALEESHLYRTTVGRIVSRIRLHYGEDVVLDCGLLTRMLPGAEHSPHADAELADGSPNHTPHRTHVGLLYLDTAHDNHEGGDLTVADETIPSETGMLVAFPSTREYWHYVSQVTSGERWALAVWCKR